MRACVASPTKAIGMLGGSLLLFAAGFALADRFQLTHGVLYRVAAGDVSSATSSLLWLAAQALLLFAAILFLGRKTFAIAMVFAATSIWVNLAYGQTLNDVVDPGRVAWLIAEARRGGDAAAEFTWPFLLALLQTVSAICLFVAARQLARTTGLIPKHEAAVAAGVALLVLPSFVSSFVKSGPEAAERNLYSAAVTIALAEPPPPRGTVDIDLTEGGAPRHIVWLMDESVAHAPFARLVAPKLRQFEHIDFGVSTSLGHCSAPSNLALRSGVDVRRAGPHMDLRTNPSIWSYARKAGYRTILVEGQTSGAPQNLLLPPELALIDQVRNSAGGIETDIEIARELNGQLRGSERTFTYVVLRGVHFQYSDHYPSGMLGPDSSNVQQYEAALVHSKGRFFEALLDRVDRENTAIIYTSDHGQNLAEGSMPHCSRQAAPDEFRVPLLAFLPNRLAARYVGAPEAMRSASQIFAATLIWMGYDSETVQARYDRDLSATTARYVRFDRDVIPISRGDKIGISVSALFLED